MKISEKTIIFVAIPLLVFILVAGYKTTPTMVTDKTFSRDGASVKPCYTYTGTRAYHNSFGIYQTEGPGVVLPWSFSTSPVVGITVYAMDASQYASWSAVSGGPYYSQLSSGSYTSDSGTFTVPYAATWYIVFWNDYYTQTSTTLTAIVTISYITITSPTNSSSWNPGSSYYIDWTSNGTSGYVTIDLYQDGAYYFNIASSVYNSGFYDWNIPSTLPSASHYQIYMYDASNSNIYGWSGKFSISAPVSYVPAIIIAIIAIVVSIALVGILVPVSIARRKKKRMVGAESSVRQQQAEATRQQQVNAAPQRQLEVGPQQQADAARQRQLEVERQQQAEAAHQRQLELDRQQQAEAAHQRQLELDRQQTDQSRMDKLKKLVAVSEKLKVSQMAQILKMDEAELYSHIVDWADEFGFKLDEDVVKFTTGRKEDFIAALDGAFQDWGTKTKAKDGKLE